MKKKILVIVAHPDDETIWIGGLLSRKKEEWDTTVICLCRRSDRDRYPKFLQACKTLGVKGFISDLDDKNLSPLNIEDIIKEILKFCYEKYDIIFTHGENGEYGHIRHREVNKAVINMLDRNLINAKKVFLFSYLHKENDYQGYCIYNSSANNLIKLNRRELSLKKHLIKKIYGYQEGGFEEKSCGEVEAFDKLR